MISKSMTKLFFLLIVLLIFAASVSAEEILYARYPALSPDGQTIAFTYMGDIWTVSSQGGQACRLTIHETEDVRPQFSPDGQMILFTSWRHNNCDAYIIPVTGGAPKQLTFHSASDYGTGWFPGGDSVLITSTREGWGDIYKVSIDGGAPVSLTGYPYEQEYNGRIVGDGTQLLYNNGSGNSRWWRRDLRSSRNADIFIQDRTRDEFTSTRLTDYDNHDVWPVLNSETNDLYFVSCRGEWAQIYKKNINGGEEAVVTSFTGDGVQWLNSNPQGTMLVFEQGLHIWIMDPADNQPRMVNIEIATDERSNLVEEKTFNGDVESFSLSPDNKKIAAVIHGEIFVFPADEPELAKRITYTPARENSPVWGAESKTIYYSSDRDGNYDIFSADVLAGDEKRLTETPENELKPIISPDGKYLACFRGLDKIIRIDLENNNEMVWVEGLFTDMSIAPYIVYDWSHDSKWLAFTMAGPTYESDIYMTNLDGDTYNISRFAGDNFRPRFSKDGKLVYFTSTINDRYDTYKIDLVHPPVEFAESSFDSLFFDQAEKDNDEKDNDKKDAEITSVVIDPDRIESRRAKAFDIGSSASYPVMSDDGKKYFFIAAILGKPEIWSIGTGDDPDLTQLTRSTKEKMNLILSNDSKSLFFLEGGKIIKCNTDGGDRKTLAFKASMDIDILKKNRQKFHETWHMLANHFYDPTFRGIDWPAAALKYEPALEHIRTDREFRNLILEMMGELRGSHMNIYYSGPGTPDEILTGELGLIPDYTALETEKAWKIAHIFEDSPADLAGLEPGMYIRNINGLELTGDQNMYSLLAGTGGRRLKMLVSRDISGETDEIEIKPTTRNQLGSLQYDNWVDERRKMVDSLSNGRLAYLHIKRMYGDRLEQFRQELVSIAEKKDGLIIDVRNNGGGYIAVDLLGILVKSPYILRDFRGHTPISENKYRSKAYEKPMTLLINNYSASNSEIFAEGFRKLQLGKIIGERTSGAVIGTGSYYLIDGTRVRRPSTGAYTTDMEDTDIHPRQPDITVENLPDDFINGRDPQLVKAVQTLMEELE